MEIETISLTEIIPYPDNPRKNDKAVGIVVKSIKEFGFRVPIILDKDNEIIAGHTRYKAAQKLNMTEIPIIRVEDLTEEQIKAFRIMDNKSQDYSKWDMELLKGEMNDLKELGYDLELTGFNDGEVYNLDFSQRKNLNIIPKEVKYEIKEGDLYQLGDHKLICGDSKEIKYYEKLMGEEKAKLIYTDPPYNINYKPIGANGEDAYAEGRFEHKRVFKDKLSDEDYKVFLKRCLKCCYIYTEGKVALFLWNGDKNLHIATQAAIESNFKINQLGAWVKNSLTFTPGCLFHKILEYCIICFKGGYKPELSEEYVKNQDNLFDTDFKDFQARLNSWYHARDITKDYKHPTQKPTELAYPAIYAVTNRRDIVLDCFGGSGSTLIACEENGRKARIIELDPYYCSVIIERWEKMTNKKAEKIT